MESFTCLEGYWGAPTSRPIPPSLMLLKEVPAYVESLGIKRPGLSTVHHWATHGRRGVYLPTLTAKYRYTCPEWIAQFFAKVDGARWQKKAAQQASPEVTLAERQRQHEAADAELEFLLSP